MKLRTRKVATVVVLLGLAMFVIGMLLVGQIIPGSYTGCAGICPSYQQAPAYYGTLTVFLLSASIPVILAGCMIPKGPQGYEA